MHDTSREAEEQMHKMISQKTPLERVMMGCSMYETSRQLIVRALRESNPQISENELRKEVFLKFYGNDFDPKTREKILEHLAIKTTPATRSSETFSTTT